MFAKSEVNGKETNDVYKFCRLNSKLHDAKSGRTKEISWSFAKFLVDKDGQVVD
jgi:glutathione peroxidase